MAGWTTGDIYTPKGDYKFPDYSGAFKSGGGSSGGIDWKGGAAKATPFLQDFVSGLSGRNKYQGSAFLQGEMKPTAGSTSKGGMNDDLTVVHHPSAGYGPMMIPGSPGKEGVGPKLGKLAIGVGVGALTGGWGGAAMGGLQGAGSFFE
jgi:hypothetical protein